MPKSIFLMHRLLGDSRATNAVMQQKFAHSYTVCQLRRDGLGIWGAILL